MARPLHPTVRLALLALAFASWPAAAELQLPLLFADGAVLQRDAPIPVWGWASPGARIQARLDGASASAVAGRDGRWQLQLPAHAAGGPYVLEVQGDGSQRRIGDVLIGDVWLASGQSNMEWPLAQARDGAREVAAATDPQLRNFKVPKAWSAQQQPRLPGGSWAAATPTTVGAFSAVAYFFARDLRQHTGVPIGIIDSTWGGSAIEAWMDAASPGVDAAQVRTRIAQMQAKDAQDLGETRRRLARWPQPTTADADAGWAAADLDDRDWDRQPLPGLWEQHGYVGMDGVAWYRSTFTLSAAEAKAGAVVGIGPADDADTTYVNGVEVGHTEGRYTEPRSAAGGTR